jgi:pimeloyl-ACP methyl ester carboxylesterase
MPTVDLDDTTIYYERAGQGPTMLFVHGLCGDASTFADPASRFTDRYTCVRYDRRGHSRSSRGTRPISDAQHADDAAALIEALDLAPCLVVASSGGANVATDLARRHGRLLRGAVLSEPPLFSVDPEGASEAMNEIGPLLARAGETGDRRAFVDGLLSIVCARVWPGADTAFREAKLANADIGYADVTSPSLDITAEDLAGVALPVLLLSGDASPPFHRSIVRRMAAALPAARHVELEDCGHVTYLEQPDQFERAVAAFAADIDRSGGAAAIDRRPGSRSEPASPGR